MTHKHPVQPIYRDIGRNITALRREHGISQAHLGDMLEPTMTRAGIANIELGDQRIHIHDLMRISRIFKVPITKLVKRSNGKRRAALPRGYQAAHL